MGGGFFQAIFWDGFDFEIVKNLHMTYEKISCKGEPNRFSSYRDPLVQTNGETSYYFIIRTEHILFLYDNKSPTMIKIKNKDSPILCISIRIIYLEFFVIILTKKIIVILCSMNPARLRNNVLTHNCICRQRNIIKVD